MQSQFEMAEAIKAIIVESPENITLLDVVKKAVPQLSEDSIKNFFSFIVNGKVVEDCMFKVSPEDKVEVLPLFAGGAI